MARPLAHARARAAHFILLVILIATMAACAPKPPPERLTLRAADYDDLEGWENDDHRAALAAFHRSCAKLEGLSPARAFGPAHPGPGAEDVYGRAADWQAPCAEAATVDADDPVAARRFFERWFRPWLAGDNGEAEGLFTGYFEPQLHGARTRHGPYRVPLHRRPPDLVTADLGLFREDLKGLRIAGRVEAGTLKPYPARAEIVSGALDGEDLEIVWVDDPVDAFFLQIQGSGRVVLDGGGVMRVGYAGSNGRDYVAIGRELVARGEMRKEDVTMQSIRAWLEAHPRRAAELMNANSSYIFFRELDGEGPIGAQGVPLTPGRSLAVDRRFVTLGVPVWLDTTDPLAPGRPLRRLLIAQDTGGAIDGPVRGDVFFGHGEEAAERAGRMKERGRYYLLLPRTTRVAQGG